MHILMDEYKKKLSYLPLSEMEKQKIGSDFDKQVLMQMLDAFYQQLTSEEVEMLEKTTTNELLAEVYLSLILKKIDYPEFVRCLDETYIKILTDAMSQLPDINVWQA